MMESKQNLAYDDESKTFLGVCFILRGFDSVKEEKVRSKLLEGGGIDAVNYGPDCSHVIVDKIVYDDPVCIAARRDGKILVNGLWVDHSFDVGLPVDPSSVMYRPMKELNGISGANSLVVCLTGYQRQDRDDIMTMVTLMGANFSKPLIASKVTHLICYKFEGEKYELAQKMKKIKLVNHHWLEDCLKAWELLPEADYDKSGYELEMMAAAKDSEEETEDMDTVTDLGKQNVISPQNTRENRIFHYSPPKSLLFSASKSLANNLDTSKVHSTPGREIYNKHLKMPSPLSAKSPGKTFPQVPPNMLDGTNISEKFDKRSHDADLSKISNKSKNKSTPTKPTSPLRPERIQSNSGSPSASNVNKLGVSGGFHIDYGVKTPLKGTSLPGNLGQTAKSIGKSRTIVSRVGSKSPILSRGISDDEEQTAISPNKSKTTASRGGSNSPMLNLDMDCGRKTPSKETLPCGDVGQTVNLANKSKTTASRGSSKAPMLRHDPEVQLESDLATKSVDNLSGLAKGALNNSRRRLKKQDLPSSDVKDFSSIRTSNSSGGVEPRQSDAQSIEPPCERTESGMEKTDGQDDPIDTTEGNTDAQLKPVKRKLLAKKTLGSKRTISKVSTTKLKGTLNLKKAILQNECEILPNGAVEMEEMTELATTVDDEAQAPNEKVENEFVRGNNKQKYAEVEAAQVGEGDISSEKEASSNIIQMKESSIEEGKKSESAKSKKSSKKTDLTESKSKSDAGEKKIAKGKKRPLSNVKSNKSKDSGEESKKDAKEDGKETVNEVKTKARPLKKLKKSAADLEKENNPSTIKQQSVGNKVLNSVFKADKTNLDSEKGTYKLEVKAEPACFILSGHRLQRKDFQQLLRRLKGRVCRDSHHWSYQATHFIVPDPIKRTEKVFAAAASGSWILKTDYLTASNEAGRLLSEEPYEWHKKCLTEDGAINLEAPRKWRLLKEKTGHGAFYGMRIVIYGECIAPPLDTLKRAIKAGDGTLLATSPPYTRFLQSGIDFAIVSPGMPRVDMWVQEFLRHEVPCVVADYLVEYVCKPGYPLEKHVQYNTHSWAEKSLENHKKRIEEVIEDVIYSTPQDDSIDDLACKECGSRDRGDEMLICGDESGNGGCGVGYHFDCLDPPLAGVPEDDWFCMECRVDRESRSVGQGSKKRGSKCKK